MNIRIIHYERIRRASRKQLRLLRRSVPYEEILRCINRVAYLYHVRSVQLLGPSRKLPMIFARHVAIYLIRQRTTMSLAQIGKVFGRDHSTIAGLLRRFRTMLSESEILQIEIEEVNQSLDPPSIRCARDVGL
jgi:chromosomal replication initiator protein